MEDRETLKKHPQFVRDEVLKCNQEWANYKLEFIKNIRSNKSNNPNYSMYSDEYINEMLESERRRNGTAQYNLYLPFDKHLAQPPFCSIQCRDGTLNIIMKIAEKIPIFMKKIEEYYNHINYNPNHQKINIMINFKISDVNNYLDKLSGYPYEDTKILPYIEKTLDISSDIYEML
jgi:paraquat-inducible protein B